MSKRHSHLVREILMFARCMIFTLLTAMTTELFADLIRTDFGKHRDSAWLSRNGRFVADISLIENRLRSFTVTVSPYDNGPASNGVLERSFLTSLFSRLSSTPLPTGIELDQLTIVIGSLFYTHFFKGLVNLQVTGVSNYGNILHIEASASFSGQSIFLSFTINHVTQTADHAIQTVGILADLPGEPNIYQEVVFTQNVQAPERQKVKTRTTDNKPGRNEPSAGLLSCFFGSPVNEAKSTSSLENKTEYYPPVRHANVDIQDKSVWVLWYRAVWVNI